MPAQKGSITLLVARLVVRGKFMKKVKSASNDLRAEYKRSDFKKFERGKYYKRVKASSNVVLLDPEVAAVFPNSVAVNKALHPLVEVAQNISGPTSGSSRTTVRHSPRAAR